MVSLPVVCPPGSTAIRLAFLPCVGGGGPPRVWRCVGQAIKNVAALGAGGSSVSCLSVSLSAWTIARLASEEGGEEQSRGGSSRVVDTMSGSVSCTVLSS